MFRIPAFERLSRARNVLIAGAGGGFDVFTGLPLYFALRQQGKNVYLANWTFSDITAEREGGPKVLSPHLVAVTADCVGEYYFPEKYLCQWFATKYNREMIIYAFKPCGTQQLKVAYEWLLSNLEIDTIVLVDGGTDSLLQGNEEEPGTPEEDMTSLAAVEQLSVPEKMIACLGFGIEHRMCHAHVLNSIADQTKKGGFLGALSLVKSMEEVKLFCRASDYVFRRMPQAVSIVVSSIISALDGEFGNYHVTDRTEGSDLFINPLMPIYWFFDVHSLAESVEYIDRVRKANDMSDVMHAIKGRHRKPESIRRHQQIPL